MPETVRGPVPEPTLSLLASRGVRFTGGKVHADHTPGNLALEDDLAAERALNARLHARLAARRSPGQ
jgi:hypothetical protein